MGTKKKSTDIPAASPSLQIGGGRVLQLVPRAAPPQVTLPGLSKDALETIGALEHLLREARAGKVEGLAFCCQVVEVGYIVDAVGGAHRNPTFTRGMLRALDDKLAIRVSKGGVA